MLSSELHVTMLAVAVRESPGYRRPAPGDEDFQLLLATARLRGVPADRLAVRQGSGADDDVCRRALGALGPPADGQPLWLVHGGPGPDPHVALLSRLVHELGWRGEATGLTHLDEAGGTAIFDLLDWATGPDLGGTVLIADEPLGIDLLDGPPRVSAVAIRVSRGTGPLRVLGAGEGAPPPSAAAARHQFGGPGPCDGWLGLRRAARAGLLGDADRVLIRAAGARRSGWVLLEVVSARWLRSVIAEPEVMSTAEGKDPAQ